MLKSPKINYFDVTPSVPLSFWTNSRFILFTHSNNQRNINNDVYINMIKHGRIHVHYLTYVIYINLYIKKIKKMNDNT